MGANRWSDGDPSSQVKPSSVKSGQAQFSQANQAKPCQVKPSQVSVPGRPPALPSLAIHLPSRARHSTVMVWHSMFCHVHAQGIVMLCQVMPGDIMLIKPQPQSDMDITQWTHHSPRQRQRRQRDQPRVSR